MRVEVAYFDTRELCAPAAYARGLAELAWDERRDAAGRYLQARDRRLCVGAGLLAQAMLADAGATDLTLAYGTYDKPYLAHHPSIHFNLSHSADYALCGVADDPIGVDIQEMVAYDDALARHCMCDDELAWIVSQGDKSLALTRLWVRKESYIKLTGEGLNHDLLALNVTGEAGLPLADEGVCFQEFQLPGCIISICMHERHELALRRWSPLWKT
jgi:4'-phosphopantetheinyl transferase